MSKPNIGQDISWARSHLSVLHRLSELDDWTVEEAFEVRNTKFIKNAIERNYIEKIGERPTNDERESMHAVYTVTEKAITAIETYSIDPEGPLPCGHHGFENMGDGIYVCSRDHCLATYTRSEIEDAYA